MSVRTWALRTIGLASMVLIVAGTVVVMSSRSILALEPPQAQAPTVAQEPARARQASRDVQVYFSRRPEPPDDFTAVFPVMRTAPDAGVARAALNALIAGP